MLAAGEAMAAMPRLGPSTPATTPELPRFHAAKRQVYSMMRKLDTVSRETITLSRARLGG